MILALFDFDGTISTRDSMVEFIKYAIGKRKFYIGIVVLSPVLVLYLLKIITNHRAKEKLIAYFFKGWRAAGFFELADNYSENQINRIVRQRALERIHWHQQLGHKVVIVTASLQCWLKKWCAMQQVELLATQVEIKDDRISGYFATKNCYGLEKVNRIKEKYNLDNVNYIYAYGDSSGDREMLALADEKYYKYFK